jgi:hypothetical protein
VNASAVVLNRFVFPSSPAPPARAAHRAARRARAPPRRSRVRVTARDARASPERIARVAIANQIANREKAINPIARSMDDSTPSSRVAIDRIRRSRRSARAMKDRTDARSRAPSASRSRRASVTRERRVGSSPSRSLFREKARRAARSTALDARVDRSRGRSIDRAIVARSIARWFRDRSIARAGARAPGRDARMATTATTRAWEDLRKDARRTESAIERELGELSALGARATRRDATIRRRVRFARDATIRRRDATRRDAMARAGD